MGKFIISLQNVFQRVQRVKNSVSLLLELMLLLLGESELTLVESLHLVDKYLVSLELEVLVSLDCVGDALGERVALLRLRTNARPVLADAAHDILLVALLLNWGLVGLLVFFGALGLEESEASAACLSRAGCCRVQQLHSLGVLL